ncbi:MAG: DUF2809 domain-containing protein [Gemmatirosa sp.]
MVALRGTRLGHLVLGTDFDARDLLAYAAGVACAAALAATLAATLVATLAARKQR